MAQDEVHRRYDLGWNRGRVLGGEEHGAQLAAAQDGENGVTECVGSLSSKIPVSIAAYLRYVSTWKSSRQGGSTRTDDGIHLVLDKSVNEDGEENGIEAEGAKNGISEIDNDSIREILAESINEWLQTPTTCS